MIGPNATNLLLSKQVTNYLEHSIRVVIQHELIGNEMGSTRPVRHQRRRVTLCIGLWYIQSAPLLAYLALFFWLSCVNLGWRNVFLKLPTAANNTYSLPTMNSAANIIPDDASPFPFTACHGREIQLLRRDETRTTVHLRFRIGKLRHEVLISREHWRWVLGVVERFPVMVAHYQYEAGGPTHMIWAFHHPLVPIAVVIDIIATAEVAMKSHTL